MFEGIERKEEKEVVPRKEEEEVSVPNYQSLTYVASISIGFV